VAWAASPGCSVMAVWKMARASGSPSPQRLSNSVHVLLEQATLCLGRDVSFHDGDDVVPQLLSRDVARKITLVSRKSACGRRGNRERRPGHLQKSDQVFRGHRHLRSTLTTMPPWHENGNVGADGDCAAADEGWRAPSRLRETCA